MPKILYPKDCVIAVTYQCNARCKMCHIWQLTQLPLLTMEDFKKLPSSLRDINISGGEPFLRKDLPEIVKVLGRTCPKAKLIISSNGLLPDYIQKVMKKILSICPEIGVAISIDGMEKMHDEIRGIPGAFDKAIDTIKGLKKLGIHHLKIAFTGSDENVGHLKKVYNLSRKLGVEFTCAVAHSSETYFGGAVNIVKNKKEFKKQFNYLIKKELSSNSPKRWARAYFAWGLLRFALKGEQVLPSRAGIDFFFLDPQGNIYPSVIHNQVMGNIRKDDFEKIWISEKAQKVREEVAKSSQRYWMICTARSAIKRYPVRVTSWIIKNKIFFRKSYV